ncbi:MAG: hypothetical protein RIR51_595 [Bacteroidota bacterium]
MQSFRTELENPLVEKDIIDLAKKIEEFKNGEIHEEKFRSLRLARGVYGQRQKGVQMIRIKLPYGKLTFRQWRRIADVSDEYSTGNLHLTTRQDIQIHYVSLDRTPELWSELEKDEVTLREACGNTVRNVTASPTSGIDPKELFDVSPHADATFRYFLRNPICQEMGRKIKISFSNTEEDTSLSYLHDLGFVPKMENGVKGFKVVVGGGLGAQPMLAHTYFEFLEENKIIPLIEAVLRVFDRHGERNSRHKARLKFLIQKIGFEEFVNLVDQERLALKNHSVEIKDANLWKVEVPTKLNEKIPSHENFEIWKKTNVFEQKQKGFYGIYVRVLNGNISTETSRKLIEKLEGYVGDDIRITINQGLMLKFVPQKNLGYVFEVLNEFGLAKAGANSTNNITSCPGTDTCNLAISDSTHITRELEKVIEDEFPELIENSEIKIKISGCMNSCGQHGMASIGFHGSSLKSPDKRVVPALQVLLGGGVLGNGEAILANKVIKVPSKRGPKTLRTILNNYEENGLEGEYFYQYFERMGEKYFYELLKPLTDLSILTEDEYIDWGADIEFKTEIGVGECAGVMVDLVGTLLFEAEEKLSWAKEAMQENRWADSIYHSYASFISGAKALLLGKDITVSNQQAVINKFDENFTVNEGCVWDFECFKNTVMLINQNKPSQTFAQNYFESAENFITKAFELRAKETKNA